MWSFNLEASEWAWQMTKCLKLMSNNLNAKNSQTNYMTSWSWWASRWKILAQRSNITLMHLMILWLILKISKSWKWNCWWEKTSSSSKLINCILSITCVVSWSLEKTHLQQGCKCYVDSILIVDDDVMLLFRYGIKCDLRSITFTESQVWYMFSI